MNTNMNIQTDIRKYEYEYEYSSHTGPQIYFDTISPPSLIHNLVVLHH